MKPLNHLSQSIRKSWDASTCYPVQKEDWSTANPELGQCAVTALLLQDYFGGQIVYNEANDHFWNILPGGETLDLTRTQFKTPVDLSVYLLCNREDILYSTEAVKQNTFHRYQLLKQRVEEKLRKKENANSFRNTKTVSRKQSKSKVALHQ